MSNTCVYDKPPCDHAALRRILGPGRFRRGSMRTRRPITPAYQCPPGGTKPSQAVGRRTGYRPNVFAEPAHGVTDSLSARAPALSTPWLTERTRPVTNWSATSGSWNDLSPTNSSSVSGWTPASDGGATITSYQVSVNGGSWTTVSTSSSTSVVNANLVNHRDRRSHGAHQRHGVHDPGSRDQQCGKRDGEQLSVGDTYDGARWPDRRVSGRRERFSGRQFHLPASNGGSAITGCTVTGAPSGSASCSASPCTAPGWTNGPTYTFTAHATNAVGSGVESSAAASAAVTSATLPDAPTGVSSVRGNGLAIVSFTAPGSNGGSAVTS